MRFPKSFVNTEGFSQSRERIQMPIRPEKEWDNDRINTGTDFKASIQSKKQRLVVARNMVDENLSRLEDSVSSKWLSEQLLQWSEGESRSSFVAKIVLLQSQNKSLSDEVKVLTAQFKRKEFELSLALQRQQDARLRRLTLGRIEEVLKFSLHCWRETRLKRIRYGMLKYRLILKNLNGRLSSSFHSWEDFITHHSRTRQLGVRFLASILNSFRQKIFMAWKILWSRRIELTKRCAVILKKNWNGRLAMCFSFWNMFVFHQKKHSQRCIKACNYSMTRLLIKMMNIWLDSVQHRSYRMNVLCRFRARWQRFKVRNAITEWQRQSAKRGLLCIKMLRIRSDRLIWLKRSAIRSWQFDSNAGNEMMASRLYFISRRILQNSFRLWSTFSIRRRWYYRYGLSIVVRYMRHCGKNALIGWAQSVQLRTGFRRLAARADISHKQSIIADSLDNWKELIFNRKYIRVVGMKHFLKYLKALLKFCFQQWTVWKSKVHSRRSEMLKASFNRSKFLALEYCVYYSWREKTFRNIFLKSLGMKVLLRSLRICMASFLFRWFAYCEHSVRGENNQVLRIVRSRILRQRLFSNFTKWAARICDISGFRSRGQKFVLRLISNQMRFCFKTWVERSRCFKTQEIYDWKSTKSSRFQCKTLLLHWNSMSKYRKFSVRAIQFLERALKKYAKIQFMHRWFRNIAAMEQMEKHIKGNVLVFCHISEMKRTWFCLLTCFHGWKYCSQIRVEGSEEEPNRPDKSGSQRALVMSAVVMSNIPKLNLRSSANESLEIMSPPQR
jgi:hypothetical protein